MKCSAQLFSVAMIALVSLALTGCFALKPKPDPSRYYVLGNGNSRPGNVDVDCERRVLVGPVTLAGHLDNPRIAKRIQPSEIVYSNWSFWAEPLGRAFPRELMFAMEKTLPDTCFFDYRKASPRDGDVSLTVFVERFEATDLGNVEVAATWSVSIVGESKRRQGNARLSKEIETGEDQVAAGIRSLNEALDELARTIAEDAK